MMQPPEAPKVVQNGAPVQTEDFQQAQQSSQESFGAKNQEKEATADGATNNKANNGGIFYVENISIY